MKYIYGDNRFTPADTIVGVDSSTSGSVIVYCVKHTNPTEANSYYTLTVSSGTEVAVGQALVENINFSKFDVIDMLAFNDNVTTIAFTA